MLFVEAVVTVFIVEETGFHMGAIHCDTLLGCTHIRF